ncbi:hypothetical protein F4561_003047 [Lipingzhangella halophila]|uniref:Uncharacterized protein n=1 Tax=Lipingzhangella halophila TaxID=1783352 RepID=A0A7W7RHY8_9ACTN|nr:hypothetical protein [Lipingzhangella halophila]
MPSNPRRIEQSFALMMLAQFAVAWKLTQVAWKLAQIVGSRVSQGLRKLWRAYRDRRSTRLPPEGAATPVPSDAGTLDAMRHPEPGGGTSSQGTARGATETPAFDDQKRGPRTAPRFEPPHNH